MLISAIAPAVRSAALFDPRTVREEPAAKRYRLANLVTNYCSLTSMDINLRYMLPRADLQAAALDHDYFAKPFLETWVLESLKVTS